MPAGGAMPPGWRKGDVVRARGLNSQAGGGDREPPFEAKLRVALAKHGRISWTVTKLEQVYREFHGAREGWWKDLGCADAKEAFESAPLVLARRRTGKSGVAFVRSACWELANTPRGPEDTEGPRPHAVHIVGPVTHISAKGQRGFFIVDKDVHCPVSLVPYPPQMGDSVALMAVSHEEGRNMWHAVSVLTINKRVVGPSSSAPPARRTSAHSAAEPSKEDTLDTKARNAIRGIVLELECKTDIQVRPFAPIFLAVSCNIVSIAFFLEEDPVIPMRFQTHNLAYGLRRAHLDTYASRPPEPRVCFNLQGGSCTAQLCNILSTLQQLEPALKTHVSRGTGKMGTRTFWKAPQTCACARAPPLSLGACGRVSCP